MKIIVKGKIWSTETLNSQVNLGMERKSMQEAIICPSINFRKNTKLAVTQISVKEISSSWFNIQGVNNTKHVYFNIIVKTIKNSRNQKI